MRPVKLRGFFRALVLGVAIATGNGVDAAGERIIGTVTERTFGIRDVDVLVMDATSAAVVAIARTNGTGDYDSGDIPIGSYKIHFRAGGYVSKFHGSVCVDRSCAEVFDLATPVGVTAGAVSRVDESLIYIGPTLVVTRNLEVDGTVTDAQTKAPINGVLMTVHDAISGLPVIDCLTDGSGHCRISVAAAIYSGIGKLRFSDPQLVYRASYHGAGGQDNFGAGLALDLEAERAPIIAEALVRKSASDLIGDILETIPPGAGSGVTDSLGRALTLLTDANPNNDAGACGVLNGVLQQINAKERNGALSMEEAGTLRRAVQRARASLGC